MNSITHHVDNFLNKITMYKTVVYGLFLLSLVAITLGFFGKLSTPGHLLLLSLGVITGLCFLTNFVISKLLRVSTNVESWFISAMILFLIMDPVSSGTNWKFFVLVPVLAMASKYIFVIGKKHIFNPVAISLVLVSSMGSAISAWWIGSSVFIIPVLIVGFLILRKVQRFSMFFAFLLAGIVSTSVTAVSNSINVIDALYFTFLSGPILFFGMIMLTEPLTTPPGRKLQVIYGLIVGILYGANFHIGSFYNSPELALVLGNIFSYLISPKVRAVLTLNRKEGLAGNIDHFYWKIDKKFSWKPGQYLEWTLGHKKPDSRGNRRYFTIASSPTEEELQLGVKFYDEPSSFKQALGEIPVGGRIIASQLAGEFTLPEDLNKKLVFIAGGIGVTPFRSMVKYMIDKGERRDAVLFFCNKTPKDIVYRDLFNEAKQNGLKTIDVVGDLAGESKTDEMRVGMLNAEMIKKEVPDYKDRMFYISGPRGLIVAFEKALKEIGVSKKNIRTDFFPGFA